MIKSMTQNLHPSSIWDIQFFMNTLERKFQILIENFKSPCPRPRTCNQHIVTTRDGKKIQIFSDQLPEAPLDPITCNRITNSFGDRKADPAALLRVRLSGQNSAGFPHSRL